MASQNKPSLKSLAQKNPTQLGDPISLKAETSPTSPTENDRPIATQQTPSTPPASSASPGRQIKDGDAKKLKDLAKANPTRLGDPVSLKAETSESEPTAEDRGALSKSKL